MNDAVDELLRLYWERFGEEFPTIPLAWDSTDEEIEKMLDECLKKGKTAYQLGMVKEGEIY